MFYLLLVLLLLLDQATKFIASIHFVEPILLHDLVRLVYAENTGIAFSLPLSFWIIVPASIVIILFFIWEIWRQKNIWIYGLIVVGALGNLIDRIAHGYVIDWISVGAFPVFNLADAYISCGLVFFMLLLLLKKA